MSSSLAWARSLLVAMGAALVLLACSDGGDDKGPQLGVHQWPVSFGNFAPPGPGPDGQAGNEDDVLPPSCQSPTGERETCHFEMIVINQGGGTLEITNVEVRGDVNCSIQDPPTFDTALPVSLAKNEQAFLAWTYLPGGDRNGDTAGNIKDQISIALTSNSTDSTLFEISTCGCILAPGADLSGECSCNLNEVPQGNCGG